MATPRYHHECPTCRFVARVWHYDIWICQPGFGARPVYIARFGNTGGDYSSMSDYRNQRQDVYHDGLTDDEVNVLLTFQLMPSLIIGAMNREIP